LLKWKICCNLGGQNLTIFLFNRIFFFEIWRLKNPKKTLILANLKGKGGRGGELNKGEFGRIKHKPWNVEGREGGGKVGNREAARRAFAEQETTCRRHAPVAC
jgi:hypothetical protein